MSRPPRREPPDSDASHFLPVTQPARRSEQSLIVERKEIELEVLKPSTPIDPKPFSRADLEDFDAGRSRRPVTRDPIVEFMCDAPRSAFAASFVHGLHHDFIAATHLHLELKYILSGCIVVALEVHADRGQQSQLRHNFHFGRYNALIGKYRIFRARFLNFPEPTPTEIEDLGLRPHNELRFDLSEVRRRA